MPVSISSSNPVTGYFAADEPPFAGTPAALRGLVIATDVPDATAPGGYVSGSVTAGQLVDAAISNPNARPDLHKQVRFLTRAEANAGFGGAVLEEIAPLSCCLHTRVLVEFYRPDPAGPTTHDQTLVMRYDTAGPLTVYRDASFTPGETVAAKWVREEDARDFEPYDYFPAGYPFASGQYVSQYVGSPASEQFFKARSAGAHPAPTAGGDPTHWEPVSFTDIPMTPGATAIPVAYAVDSNNPPIAFSNATDALEGGEVVHFNYSRVSLSRDTAGRNDYVGGAGATLLFNNHKLSLANTFLDRLRLVGTSAATLEVLGDCGWADGFSGPNFAGTILLADGNSLRLHDVDVSAATFDVPSGTATVTLLGTTSNIPNPPPGLTIVDLRASTGGISQSYVDAADASRFKMRGAFAGNTLYQRNDVVLSGGVTYYRNAAAFTSAASFNAANWVAFSASRAVPIDYAGETTDPALTGGVLTAQSGKAYAFSTGGALELAVDTSGTLRNATSFALRVLPGATPLALTSGYALDGIDISTTPRKLPAGASLTLGFDNTGTQGRLFTIAEGGPKVVQSPNGSSWQLVVSNAGTLTPTLL